VTLAKAGRRQLEDRFSAVPLGGSSLPMAGSSQEQSMVAW